MPPPRAGLPNDTYPAKNPNPASGAREATALEVCPLAAKPAKPQIQKDHHQPRPLLPPAPPSHTNSHIQSMGSLNRRFSFSSKSSNRKKNLSRSRHFYGSLYASRSERPARGEPSIRVGAANQRPAARRARDQTARARVDAGRAFSSRMGARGANHHQQHRTCGSQLGGQPGCFQRRPDPLAQGGGGPNEKGRGAE